MFEMIRLFLDADGVVSAEGVLKENVIKVPSNYTTFNLREEVAEWLIKLSSRLENNDNIKVSWSSQWDIVTNDINAVLDIKDFDYLIFDEDILEEFWFKTYKFIRIIEENPDDLIIIVDDEFTPEAKNKLSSYSNVLLIQPTPEYGLSNSELKLLDTLLDNR